MVFHPDTGRKIEGKIPGWESVRKTVYAISKKFFGVEWMGFDVCIDSHGKMRIMEINSHPGIKYMQVFSPFMKSEKLRQYFEKKKEWIQQMSETDRLARAKIQR